MGSDDPTKSRKECDAARGVSREQLAEKSNPAGDGEKLNMTLNHTMPRRNMGLLAWFFATSIVVLVSFAETSQGQQVHPKKGDQRAADSTRASSPEPAAPPSAAKNWHARRGVYFQRNWGVDIVGVRRVSSGYMLEFRYRVLDPAKAQVLNDKNARAYLIDEVTGARLAVPAMENIGELRQSAAPEANRTYFILFGNPGGLVKRGGPVSVVIGAFRVDGLVVD
jgi:hypothetical protein